jgi:predicted AlkP superfamily pyrophosphatase or phosphodiesterase
MRLICLISLILVSLFFEVQPSVARPEDYKLGIVISVDQFRADYLMRFREKFKGGYKLLLEKGAYLPLADHGLLQNMTAPGHAAILTGSYPYRNHIPLNTWFDRETSKVRYCVQDDQEKLVGSKGVLTDSRMGVSPRSLNASTVGDELKNVDRASRVVSLSIKDRAAILMGGHRTDATVWFDQKQCEWVTSTFFSKTLPEFAQKQNVILNSERNQKFSWGPFHDIGKCSKDAIPTPWGIQKTIDLANSAIDEMKLGRGTDTDLLAISFSSHDYLGHQVGPNSPYMEAMTLAEDQLLGEFFAGLAKRVPGGLSNVFVVLTGDHGMVPSALPKERVDFENVRASEVTQLLNDRLDEVFGKPKSGNWIAAETELQFYFNEQVLADKKLKKAEVYAVAREKLLKERYIDDVWSRDEIMRDRKVPPGELGQIADRSLSSQSGDLIPILKPYFYSDGWAFTHMTHYSYERYVPLVFMGKTFKAGTYRQIVRVIDIGPTLSSVLHVLPPSQSEGRVITEILRVK